MPTYRYRTVDVFTTVVFEGNPLAVFPDARGLDTATMQRIARELNLSETTFVTPATAPHATARVRIFTPAREMPFAGHPTLGTAFVVRDEGGAGDAIVLEENVGDVPVRVETDDGHTRFWLTAPPISFGAGVERGAAAAALGLTDDDLLDLPPETGTVGPTFLYVAVRDRAAVDRASYHPPALRGALPPHGIFVFAPVDGGAYARMFDHDAGITEDPATGSATAPLAAYLVRHGLAPRTGGLQLLSEQGVKMGRRSLLYVRLRVDGDALGVDVGGSVVPVAEATLRLP